MTTTENLGYGTNNPITATPFNEALATKSPTTEPIMTAGKKRENVPNCEVLSVE
jgi:hypothetical protein